MKNIRLNFCLLFSLVVVLMTSSCIQKENREKPLVVPLEVMNKVYEEIKTPYKYGLVLVPDHRSKMIDSPSVFRAGDKWYMTYIVFDGKGYETFLATSDNLLDWIHQGKLMPFTENTWDANQKAGYIALQDFTWGGSYEVNKHDNKYWMSYLGGATEG